MNKSIRIAQMSDLHYSAKNLVESDRCFSYAVDHAINSNCEAAVITGDSTDHALDAHSPALRALARQVKRLADHCPVLMVQGTFSHEPAGLLRIFEMLGSKFPITVADKIGVIGFTLGVGFEPFVVGTDYQLVITAFPTVNKADLMSSGEASGLSVEMGELVYSLLKQFGGMNSSLRAKGIPTMVVGHGTVDSCITEHGVPMAGPDHEFGVGALFSANADAVALGHIHKHQVWERETDGVVQRIAYPGSIGRFHYGEEGAKHYLLWDMVAGDSRITPVETPSKKTVDIFFDGPPDLAVIEKAAANCIGAFVRVRYFIDEEHTQVIDRKAILTALGCAEEVQIEGKKLPVQRQRAPGISSAGSLEEKLGQWCKLTGTPTAELGNRLALLQSMTPGEIVKKVLVDLDDSCPANQHDVGVLELIVKARDNGMVVVNDEKAAMRLREQADPSPAEAMELDLFNN